MFCCVQLFAILESQSLAYADHRRAGVIKYLLIHRRKRPRQNDVERFKTCFLCLRARINLIFFFERKQDFSRQFRFLVTPSNIS